MENLKRKIGELRLTCDRALFFVFFFSANGWRRKKELLILYFTSRPLLLRFFNTCQQRCYLVSCCKCEPIKFYWKFMGPVVSTKETKRKVYVNLPHKANSKLKCLLIPLRNKNLLWNIRIFFIENNQKSGNKGYNRYIPGDSSQLRQLHMSLTLSVSLLINDALAFAPDSGLRADDSWSNCIRRSFLLPLAV